MKILLLSKDAVFLADTAQKKFQTQYGEINLEKVRIGKKIKSTKGKEFIVAAPTLIDLLKKAKRGPQIITPKDAGAIAAITGVTSGWRCLDAGSGSGFLALFLGNLVRPNGNVYTYEKKKENYEIVKKNIVHCGLEETVTVKNADALKGFKEKNLDLITLDMQFAEKLGKKKVFHLTITAARSSHFLKTELFMLRLTCIRDKRVWFSFDFTTQETLSREESLDATRWINTCDVFSEQKG